MRKLSILTKLTYGLGQVAEGVKGTSFSIFMFFYYNQVLGLSGTLAGTAAFIAMCFDAVSDPVAGSLSDNLSSRWGRRHPFMYASAIPLAITFYLVFTPPAGLGQTGLFLWMTTFAVLVRASMTLYHVPHLALGAELSDDYEERTSIVGFRTAFGTAGGAGMALLGLFFFFAATPEFENGQLDPSAYPRFALTGAVIMLFTIWISAIGTHRQIPFLHVSKPDPTAFGVMRVLGEMREAVGNRSFRALFTGMVTFAVLYGVYDTLIMHMGTHFYRMTTQQIGIYVVGVLTGLVSGAFFARVLNAWIDKKPTLFVGVLLGVTFTGTPPVLWLLDLLPPSTDPWMLRIIVCCSFLGTFFRIQAGVTGSSIMADIADEHDLKTGRRREGIFFGAISFSGKAAHGLGIVVAGFAIDLIGFMPKTEVGAVPHDVLVKLGLFYGPCVWFLSMFALLFYTGITLNRRRAAEIRAALAERNAATASQGAAIE